MFITENIKKKEAQKYTGTKQRKRKLKQKREETEVILSLFLNYQLWNYSALTPFVALVWSITSVVALEVSAWTCWAVPRKRERDSFSKV